MPKATDDTCLSDLERKMVTSCPQRSRERIFGAKNAVKSCWKGKIHSTFKSSKVAGTLVQKVEMESLQSWKFLKIWMLV